MEPWMEEETARLVKQFGTVPPPWVAFPDTHPHSLMWRMGAGESFVMLWSAWWRGQAPTEPERVAYFRRFPPPPRWLEWMLDALWNPNPAGEEDFDFGPYFARAEALGFGTREEYERDMDDPRWLEG